MKVTLRPVPVGAAAAVGYLLATTYYQHGVNSPTGVSWLTPEMTKLVLPIVIGILGNFAPQLLPWIRSLWNILMENRQTIDQVLNGRAAKTPHDALLHLQAVELFLASNGRTDDAKKCCDLRLAVHSCCRGEAHAPVRV